LFNSGVKKLIIGIVLFALPAGFVQWAKRSDWGAALTAPQYRHKGAAKAPVTIVEYSDFQCPSCASIQPTIKALMQSYEGKVRLVFKHYPLTKIHLNAMPAAVAAECAGAQNKFWPYHDKLFENQSRWAPLTSATTMFMAYAGEIELDQEKFSACLSEPRAKEAVSTDSAEAVRRQVRSTPSFFVGETRLVGSYLATDGARTIEKEIRQ